MFQNLEFWGAGQLLGLPGCLPEEPLSPAQTWSYPAGSSAATEGKLLRTETEVAVLSLKLESTKKYDSGSVLETRFSGDVIVRFDAKRGLPREMKGSCRQSVVQNQTTTLLQVPGSEFTVEATITPAR
jgi:hypothetical protein